MSSFESFDLWRVCVDRQCPSFRVLFLVYLAFGGMGLCAFVHGLEMNRGRKE